MAPPRTTSDASRCSAFAVTVTLVLLATVASNLPAAARASAIRSQPAVHDDDGSAAVHLERHRRDVGPPTAVLDVARTAASAVAAANDDAGSVRGKRSLKLLKLKPLILLPAKLALGTGNKLVAGAKLGAKAARVGVKAVGAGLVGLKAVSKVAKVTVKAATALGVKAVLLNFLFHKINQVIDFKTRLLHNLDQKNRQQNAQFLSGVLPASSARPASGSIGNKDDDDFLASSPGDQQVLAQEQSKSIAPSPGSDANTASQEEDEVTFDANKVSLQVPDTLFGPSFTAVNGISQTIANVIQNTATRLARLVEAIKTAVFRKLSGVSSISNSSGGLSGGGGGGGVGDGGNANANRGSRDTATDLDDGLESDPLDDAAKSSVVPPTSKKRSADPATAAVIGTSR